MAIASRVAPAPSQTPLQREKRHWRARLGRIAMFAFIALLVVSVLGIFCGWLYMRPVSNTLDPELTYRVNELAGPNMSVKNVVLRVTRGDGSFTWAGAAGSGSEATHTPMTADAPIYIASVTKLFTATAVMRLYESGALSLDDTVDRYLPGELIDGIHVYQGHDYSHAITIRQLLSQTSGLPDYYEDKAADGKSLFELLRADPRRNWTVDEMIGRARDLMAPHFVPGTDAYYADTNYLLLGKIIEKVTGEPLQTVFHEDFFQPLGLKHTWLVGRSRPEVAPSQPVADVFYDELNISSVRSNTAFWADGGIVSTTEDMIAFLKALNNGEVIHKDTLQLMRSNWRQLQNMPFHYGLGTMYFSLPGPINSLLATLPGGFGSDRVWGHTGSVGSFLYYSEDLDLYMAGSVDQTQDTQASFLLMMRVMNAVQQLR